MLPSRTVRWGAALTGLVAALAVTSPAYAADPRPDNPAGATVALVSTSVTPGGKVSFTGTGFVNADGTGSVVMVKIDDGAARLADGSDVFTSVKASDTTGEVSGSVTLPSTVTGSGHWLRMLTGSGQVGDTTRSLHTGFFTVEAAPNTPAVTLAADTVTAGASLTASGVHYPANSTVTVKLDKTTIVTTFTSGADGSFSGKAVPVPAGIAEGAHTLHFLAAGVSVQVNFTVAADEPEEPGAVSATVTITASVPDTGALAIKVSSGSVALSTPQVTSELDALVSTGELPTVTVSDLRAANPGWSVSGQIGDFSGTAGTVDGKYLGWTPKIVSAASGQQVKPGAAVAAGTGLKSASALATAASGAGRGTAALGAGLELRLPTTTAPGDYSATLTLTAI
ncbi:hypothetical protein AB0F72_01255 [Actinoplanes sp. NPDC023936]|uniref:hypothetical protein n=1 Tax=Actinoplanes sp. NPDC023936 TaxID=3154910 RepID=UPI0033C3CCE5